MTHNNICDGASLELQQRHDCEAQSCHQSDHVTAKWSQFGYLNTCRPCTICHIDDHVFQQMLAVRVARVLPCEAGSHSRDM